ncbi:nonribosomal peptide synthetase 1 [Arthroderma uncinatum]|uniref:nonribosomal peptide synthetase 1 n=1 Tax=Arthroderma uncinatum TaxID=74035 RepID=UPI00144A625C|nr:nonribosomal peptide synthetase 1 [Arthroderma uncinatum]KAF3480386.1 nonribosomal peptide synthetase 1 [Arthroderma uncinatum]
MLSDGQAANVGTTFEKIFSNFKQKPNTSLRDLEYMSKSHLDQLWKFNSKIPEQPWMECFHNVVEERAVECPSAQAIDAYDAKFTYYELNRLANRLAKYLQNHGIGPGVIVPICFERSAWAIVAMLGVSKAGGAFVSIPPYLPPGRRESMIQMISPSVLLTTSDFGHLWPTGLKLVSIEGNRIDCLPNCDGAPNSGVKPTDLFYIIFTSGSTGIPKGCMVSHSSFLNGALRKAPEWKFGPDCRVLQMLSHTFDMSLLEICTSLGSGACVCVPRTEEIEESLASTINKYNVTLAIMTPSLARKLKPEAVPGLRVLCLGGESFPKELVTLWSEKINLFQFYGPSECSINSSTRAITHRNTDPLNIGVPNNAACWVVSPGDYNKLVPVGAIGELLVSGPIVGLGYLNNPVKTSLAFLNDVAFLQGDPQYRGWHCYKTGDLVRWNSDGTLTFCGRVDTQVKLNGQRLELGEVEYHLTLHNDVRHAVAIVPKSNRCKDNLMAIISLKSRPDNPGMKYDISTIRDHSVDKIMHSLRKELQNALPRYMVPTIWAFINFMPMSASGKIDRIRVRKWAEGMPETTFFEITRGNSEPIGNLSPTTHMEQVIQEVWSNALDVPPQQVGLHHSFIQLGGNSILAQEVVAKCRKNGIGLTMTDILTCDGVAGAASLTTPLGKQKSTNGLSLHTTRLAWRTLREKYDLSRLGISHLDDVEDIYPCTPMQVGMFIGQIRKPGSYHLRFFYKAVMRTGNLPELTRVKDAWNRVVGHHPSLRTVFVDDLGVGAGYHSIVLRQPRVEVCVLEVPTGILPSEAMEVFTKSVKPFAKGSPFHRMTICACGDKAIYFMLEISHALVDGAAMENLMRDFATACDDSPLLHQPQPYRDFVEYVAAQNTEASAEYWTSYLQGCPPCMIPVSKQVTFDDLPARFLRRDFTYERSRAFLARCKEMHITVASAVRVAWAMVLRAYTGSHDVCFTYVAAGRDVPLKDVDKMVGLCLSIQPCRARLASNATFLSLAEEMQHEYIESMPYQHYPLTELKARLYPQGSEAMFNTAVSMEWTARTDPYAGSSISFEEIREQDDPTEYDIVANVDIIEDNMKLGFLYWPSLTETDVMNMSNTFAKALNCLLECGDVPIESVPLLSDSEVHLMNSLNHLPLDYVETGIFEAIEERVMSQPDAQAVLSWDGECTYSELVMTYTKFAKHLIGRGVNRGDNIVICLDKSCWSIIAILAVLRSGATFVATNPLHSQQRLTGIVEHCHAKLIIADSRYISLFETVGTPAISIDKAAIEATLPNIVIPIINGTDTATIVYTSGTTGIPKGILIDHGSLATSVLLGHGKSYKFDRGTRALQFAAFTFDACLQEIATVLSHGGCVCVPSEDERLSNLPGCINQMQVNLALFTPTVARLIKPQDVPCLKTMILCGEPMSRQDLETWASSVALYNGYGPAETTICVSVSGPLTETDDTTNIGYAVRGTRLWVTEVADDNRLAPTGCIGQLAVESRQVSQGYLDDAERTAAGFIKPAWLPGGRVYKTGDLVRWNTDGSLNYCGRKDTQVKIRGQRVELSEVEHHVNQCLPDALAVVAEAIQPSGKDSMILAAFVCTKTGLDSISINKRHSSEGAGPEAFPISMPKSLIEQLEDRLPCYMVPAVFFTMSEMPITISGKTDRQRLRDAGSRFTSEQLAQANNQTNHDGRAPLDARELKLQQLWSSVLKVDSSRISLDDSFFRLGGDSVSAMRLVTAARKSGIMLTVADIFRHPHIDEQATISLSSSNTILKTLTAKPFVYVQRKDLERVLSLAGLGPYAKDASNVEDVLPATDVQAFYVSRAAKSSQDALNYFYLTFNGNLDLTQLRKACQDVIDHFSILRTIFIPSHGKTYQVIIRKIEAPFEVIDTGADLDQTSDNFCLRDLEKEIKPGSLFLALTLIRHLHFGSRLIFRMSHAQYDGMSWPLILRCLQEAYIGTPLSPTLSFANFASYTFGRASESRKYWAKLLQGSAMTRISTKFAVDGPQHGMSKIHVGKTLMLPVPPKGTTVASLVSSAWSFVLRQITEKMDVTYGFIVAGRNANIPQIQTVVGPCMNTIPVRVRFGPTWTTVDLLNHVMDQYLSMGEADSLGLQDIVENCTQWPSDTKLDSLLQYHDIDETPNVTLSADSKSSVASLDWFRKPYAVPTNIEISARPKAIKFDAWGLKMIPIGGRELWCDDGALRADVEDFWAIGK